MEDMLIIEKSVLDELESRIRSLNEKLEQLCVQKGLKERPKWLDGQEACQMMGVSKRTLQSHRDRGVLSYTQIGAKIFYKPADIETLVSGGHTCKCKTKMSHYKSIQV